MLALFAASLKAPKQNWFLRMVIILSFIPHHIILILFFFYPQHAVYSNSSTVVVVQAWNPGYLARVFFLTSSRVDILHQKMEIMYG